MSGIYKNIEKLELKVINLQNQIDKLSSYNEIELMRKEDKSYFRGKTIEDIYLKNKQLNDKLKKEKKKRLIAEEELSNSIKLLNKLVNYFNLEIKNLIESNNNLNQKTNNLVKLIQEN
mgnify:CR=1 FL=1